MIRRSTSAFRSSVRRTVREAARAHRQPQARHGAIVRHMGLARADELEARTLLSAVAAETLALAATTDAAPDRTGAEPRIAGGVQAAPGEYPFMISLQDQFGNHICGGVLIRPDWVLTAASCAPDAQANLQIVAGINDLRNDEANPNFQVRGASQVFLHPDFAISPVPVNDLALIQLDTPFELNDRVQTVDFATEADAALIETSDLVTAIGFGRTFINGPESDQLREADLAVNDLDAVAETYERETGVVLEPATHLSAGTDTVGIGEGDQGGPLLARKADGSFVVVGISSFGSFIDGGDSIRFGSFGDQDGLAQFESLPGVFTRVATYADYIESILEAENPNSGISGVVFADADGDGNVDAGEQRLAGQTVFIDANGNGVFDSASNGAEVFASTDTPLNLPDLVNATSTIAIGPDDTDLTTVSDVNVTLNILHTFTGDLVIDLVGPDGTVVNLMTQNGGGGNDIFASFDDDAAASITESFPPYNGIFRPIGNLSDFNGSPAQGNWTLRINDVLGADAGVLLGWALTFDGSIVEQSTETDATGRFAFENLVPGLYNIGLAGDEELVLTNPETGLQRVQVAVDQGRDNVNFGVQPPSGTDDLIAINPLNDTVYVGRSTGSEFENLTYGRLSIADPSFTVLGDFNGDGRDDVAARGEDGAFEVLLSRRDTVAANLDGTGLDGDLFAAGETLFNVEVTDFNDDGLDDIFARTGSGELLLAQSTGDGFEMQSLGNLSVADWQTLLLGDVNGDGLDDVVARFAPTGTFYVGFNTGNLDDGGAPLRFDNHGTFNPAATFDDFLLADFDGDGADELHARVRGTGGVYIASSNGDFFDARVWDVWNPAVTFGNVMVGDFNGDGRADLFSRVQENGAGYLSLSQGTRFFSQSQGTIPDFFVDYAVGDFDGDGADDLAIRNEASGTIVAGIFNGSRLDFSVWGRWSPIDWDLIGAANVSGLTRFGDPDDGPVVTSALVADTDDDIPAESVRTHDGPSSLDQLFESAAAIDEIAPL